MSSTFKAGHRSNTSKDAATYRVHRRFTDDAVEQLLSCLDCPRALTVWLLYSNKEHDQLVNLETNPFDYNGYGDFHDAYIATNLLAKADFLKLATNREDVALEKFLKYEDLCRCTNRHFRRLGAEPIKAPFVWLLNAVKRKISSVLGDFKLDEMFDHANWGPGVTLSIKGENATSVNKFQLETGITRDLYSLLCAKETPFSGPLLARYPLWHEHLETIPGFPTFEVGSNIVTVPKDAKTNRVICIEPGLNLWFQKGIGSMLRRRLRSKGVELNDQRINQSLAKAALIRGLATVDFSSASDSIAYELVREVIPPDWFHVMDVTRSHFGVYQGLVGEESNFSFPSNYPGYKNPGRCIKWEKFSSMGNGFTFELESLIFFAAASAVVEYLGGDSSGVSVYGDDVIIPVSCYKLFSEFSNFLGFKVNLTKSFAEGVFRESCGSHYFSGVDVKPIFLKKRLTTLSSVFKFGNAVRRLAHARLDNLACDRRLLTAFQLLVRSVPVPLRFRVPDGYGDGGFIANHDEANPQAARRYPSQEGYFTRYLRFSAVKAESEGVGLLLDRLRSSSTQGPKQPYGGRTYDPKLSLALLVNDWRQSDFKDAVYPEPLAKRNSFALRGRVHVKVSKLYVNQWYDLGPWI